MKHIVVLIKTMHHSFKGINKNRIGKDAKCVVELDRSHLKIKVTFHIKYCHFA